MALHLEAVRRQGRLAKRLSGKSLIRQSGEIWALRLGRGNLSADEYYWYGLYDDAKFSWPEKKRFFGGAMEDRLCHVLNSWHWHAMAWDKPITNALLEYGGIPTARIFAVYDHLRYLGPVPCLHRPEEVARYLRESIPYPFVSKPTWGIAGKGILLVERFDRERDVLALAGGQERTVDSFVAELLEPRPAPKKLPRDGVFFQEKLTPHPTIAAACGERMCTVRLVVLLTESGPTLFRAYWRIATGERLFDNFQKGESGNLVAAVDLASGRVTRCVGKGASGPEEVSTHPDTGKELVGMTLPAWQETVTLTKKAALLMPGIRMQAWDVAICAEGPIFLELNVVGGFYLPQFAESAGICDAELESFLEPFGFPRA